jgi:Sec-independent protein translocase protein TatA
MGQAVREFSKAKDEVHNEITRPPTPEPQKLEEHKTESDSQAHDSHTRVV